MRHYWVTCLECGDAWVAPFQAEFGMLIPVDKHGESCTDCGGEIEIDTEYEPGEEKESEREIPFDF